MRSTLTHFKSPTSNFTNVTPVPDYEKVGLFAFESKLHPLLKYPHPSLPTFTHLPVKGIEFTKKSVQKVEFEVVTLIIQSYPEDTDSELLDELINKFSKELRKELYFGYPHAYEGIPLSIETPDSVYSFFEDKSHIGGIHIKREP